MAVRDRDLNPHTRGLSLIELLVALALGLIVVAGVIQIYISAKQAYRTNEALARVQEAGRFALLALSRDIRMAGYSGCANANSVSVNNIVDLDGDGTADPDYSFGSAVAVQIDDEITSPPGVSGTDRITVLFAMPQMVPIVSTGNAAATAEVKIQQNPYNLSAGDVIVVTDCEHADIFAATTVSGGTPVTIAIASANNTTPRLSKDYNKNYASVMRVLSRRYYIGDTGRTDDAGQPIRALFRQDNGGAAVELVEGVHDMEITVGIDTDGDGAVNQYVPPNTVTQPEQIIAVTIELWVRSLATGVTEGGRSFTFGGATITPGDTRLHQVFSTTVGLRNRLP